MSCVISNNEISLTRGDTLIAQVTLMDGCDEYEPQEGDVIRFAMKKNYGKNEVLIKKEIPIDTLVLEILPEDTKSLSFGDYVYDVEIEFADGRVDTFIPKGVFRITEEVD